MRKSNWSAVVGVVAMTFLGGCANGPMVQQYKASNPEAQGRLDAALAKCKYEATAGAVSAGVGSSSALEVAYRKTTVKDELFLLCMRANGWDMGK
jgi:hypothetical protein